MGDVEKDQTEALEFARGGSGTSTPADWPDLPLDDWADTCATLHLWTQIVGKVRLALTPPINHSWHVTLYPSSAGLTTSPIPSSSGSFEIEFDFVRHALVIRTSRGLEGGFELAPQSVATFHRRLMGELGRLGIDVRIHHRPNEIADPIPFARDEIHASYDADYANRFWRILDRSALVMGRFRGGFIGKCSPVHFFWGSADLAVTRFSGRTAPEHPGGVPYLPDEVTREAYSHDLISCGFWPGGGPISYPAYYAYAYPTPAGFADADPGPQAAFYSQELGEFVLPYDAVRQAPDPEKTLMHFLRNTYEGAADLAGWDRGALERPIPPRPRPKP